MPGKHSKKSPSSAHRWRLCKASVKECEGLPDTAGEEAIQGTVFHEVAAQCVEYGIEPWGFVGSRVELDPEDEDSVGWREFTREMAMGMLPGLDLIDSIVNARGDLFLFVETKVDLSPWLGPDEFGTADCFIIDVANKKLIVFDWKWGAGVPVQPEWNDQVMLYALGVWNTAARGIFEKAGVTDPGQITVEIIIEQPRASGGGGFWTISMAALLAEGRAIKADAEEAESEDPPYNPGPKQCLFCAAAKLNTCKARNRYLEELLDVEDQVEDVELVGPQVPIRLGDRRSMTPEQRSFLLRNRKMITDWLQQLHDEAMEDSARGLPVPTMKRIAGRASARKWRDEKKAEYLLLAELGEEAYKKSLLSPAMVEGEVGKAGYRARFARHVVQSEGAPILVPEEHPGEALESEKTLLDSAWVEAEEADETETAEQLI